MAELVMQGGHGKDAKPAIVCQEWFVRFRVGGCDGPGRDLRIASEYFALRLAARLGVPVPRFEVVDITPSPSKVASRVAEPGPAVASARVCSAREVDLQDGWPEDVGVTNDVLSTMAGIRVLDTLVMNFDRRKEGHLLLTDDGPVFIDFDKAFIAKADQSEDRPHWSAACFQCGWLACDEILSGVRGLEEHQNFCHFQSYISAAEQLDCAFIEAICEDVNRYWAVGPDAVSRWQAAFWKRHSNVVAKLKEMYPQKTL